MKTKNNLIILAIISVFLSCNNNEQEEDKSNTNNNNTEQILFDQIKKYPDSTILKENLIQFYREHGNYSLAIKTIDDYLKSDSTNGRFWNIKAILHVENEDTINSIAAFEKEFNYLSSPTDSLSLASLYAGKKNDNAITIADKLIKDYNTKYRKESVFIKGIYEASNLNNFKAIEYFDNCINMDYTFMEAYREKAIGLMSLNKYKVAIATLNKAVTLKNNFDEGYFYLGKCYEKTNELNKAKEAYEKALLYSPDYTEAKEALDKLESK